MPALTISTKNQLEAWIRERCWLDLANVHSLNPRPSLPDEPPSSNEVNYCLNV